VKDECPVCKALMNRNEMDDHLMGHIIENEEQENYRREREEQDEENDRDQNNQ